jgi:hypothetical protein
MAPPTPPAGLEVTDSGTVLRFTHEDLLRYHGPSYPGGVAHAYKVLERTLPLLDGGEPPERREIHIDTAFRGPGARDAFELVTRAVTEDRYTVDHALTRAERGETLERYVFRLRYRTRTLTAILRGGYVTDEFITLSRQEGRSSEEERRLAVLKIEMSYRLLARPATEVYDAEQGQL